MTDNNILIFSISAFITFPQVDLNHKFQGISILGPLFFIKKLILVNTKLSILVNITKTTAVRTLKWSPERNKNHNNSNN